MIESIRYLKRDRIAFVTLNRPEAKNAIDPAMHDLLATILDAHGGMNRWNEYEKVEATIVSGGGVFWLKGMYRRRGGSNG